ncbi:T9SS C-terminal target domain-containing protein, partial [Vicingaceae bacterium]|nr:T9SS C-terminal target domain-containing protein [Vicingaceae bacterium]
MSNYKDIMRKFGLVVLVIFTISEANARRNNNLNKSGGETPVLAAGCATAVAKATLELNNVRTRIEATGGSMWQDRANGVADYEVPKRGNVDDPKFTSIYAGALWMAGQDVNGQLKIAAVTFRSTGNDFWPGPLNTTTAEIDAATCVKYDQFYGVSRSMIDEFNAWFDCKSDGLCDETTEFPGYQIPDAILNWPAHGNVSLGEDWHLAPFYDRDGDDFYDPNSGDYPKYDLIGDIDCRTTRDVRLYGDTTVWFVFNDKGNVHQETGGP